jgi:uncharacterized delta-60 repeat protein
MRRAGIGLVVLGVMVLALPATASSAPGDLVRSFSGDGKAVSDFGGEFEVANDVVALPGGGFVVAGTAYALDSADRSHILLASYKRNGKLDRAFGDGGVVATSVATRSEAEAVAVQPDGKFLVAGSAKEPDDDSDVALARYNADGSLDQSFGSGGVVISDFVESTRATKSHIPASFDAAHDVALQADGRIAVSGTVDDDPAVIRYLPNGALDESFAAAGVAKLAARFEPFSALEVLADGRLLVAGGSSSGAPLLVRYLPNGVLDASFSDDGIVAMPGGPCAAARDMAIADDRLVLVAGKVGCGGRFAPDPIATLARYSPDGDPDTTFSEDGSLEVPGTSAYSLGLVVENDSKPIIVAGDIGFLPRQQDFLVARFRSNGKRDRSFSNGRVTTDFQDMRDSATDAVIAGQRLIVVGQAAHAAKTGLAIAVYRLG